VTSRLWWRWESVSCPWTPCRPIYTSAAAAAAGAMLTMFLIRHQNVGIADPCSSSVTELHTLSSHRPTFNTSILLPASLLTTISSRPSRTHFTSNFMFYLFCFIVLLYQLMVNKNYELLALQELDTYISVHVGVNINSEPVINCADISHFITPWPLYFDVKVTECLHVLESSKLLYEELLFGTIFRRLNFLSLK